AAAAGQPVFLNPAGTTASGTYTITIGGASGTTGLYTAQVYLNAVLEAENNGGPSNDSRAAPQGPDSSFITLAPPTASAGHGAVLGGNAVAPPVPFSLTDFEDGQGGYVINNGPLPGHVAGLWHLSAGRGSQTGHSATHSFYFGQHEGPNGGGNYN